MKRSTAILAVVLALALCGACAGRPTLPIPLPIDVPFSYHLQTSSGGDGAALEGTLDLQDGCLVVLPSWEGVDEEDLRPIVPVVPIAVTEWDGTTLTVNGESAAVGEEISLGGGFHSQIDDDWFVPEGCPVADGETYFVVGVFS